MRVRQHDVPASLCLDVVKYLFTWKTRVHLRMAGARGRLARRHIIARHWWPLPADKWHSDIERPSPFGACKRKRAASAKRARLARRRRLKALAQLRLVLEQCLVEVAICLHKDELERLRLAAEVRTRQRRVAARAFRNGRAAPRNLKGG